VLLVIIGIGCNSTQQKKMEKESMKPAKDINTVKEAHTPELMNIHGVVGVYIGETDDGVAFIGVMVKKKTPEIDRKIPQKLEGYPVHVEETGEIKPLK
jgi:hypothetical protein